MRAARGVSRTGPAVDSGEDVGDSEELGDAEGLGDPLGLGDSVGPGDSVGLGDAVGLGDVVGSGDTEGVGVSEDPDGSPTVTVRWAGPGAGSLDTVASTTYEPGSMSRVSSSVKCKASPGGSSTGRTDCVKDRPALHRYRSSPF
jgi:hypothetical protein